jgi:hypothetical protein
MTAGWECMLVYCDVCAALHAPRWNNICSGAYQDRLRVMTLQQLGLFLEA